MSEENEVPNGWKICTINQLGRIQTGTTPSKSNPEFYSNEFPFYKPTDLDAGINVSTSRDSLSKLGMLEARCAPVNSILITCIGATIGKTGLTKSKGAFNQQINSIEPFNGIEPKFVYYQATSHFFQSQIFKNASATTLPILNKGRFEILNMRFCSVKEQHRIVAKIEELFSSLDKAIESINTAKEQLKVYRQAVLKWAFEGRLTNKNVKDGELPEGWKSSPLDEITIRAKKVKLKEQNPDQSFIYIDIGAIDNSIFKIVSHKIYKWKDAPSRAQQIIKTNDTLFSTVRTYLKNIAFVDKEIYDSQIGSSGFCIIRANLEKAIPRYLFFYSLYQGFITPLNKLQTGTSYPAVRDEDIFSQSINYPKTISEQILIVSEIESRLSVCDKIEESIETSLIQAEALRQSILKKAFEGKLVPQDPNDEPASKLLERIEREREKRNLVNGKKEKKSKS